MSFASMHAEYLEPPDEPEEEVEPVLLELAKVLAERDALRLANQVLRVKNAALERLHNEATALAVRLRDELEARR